MCRPRAPRSRRLRRRELHSASGYADAVPLDQLEPAQGCMADSQNRLRFVIKRWKRWPRRPELRRASASRSARPCRSTTSRRQPGGNLTALVKAISPMGLAYLHVLRSAPLPNASSCCVRSSATVPGAVAHSSAKPAMPRWRGAADFIVFGKLFLANPDLPARFEQRALNPFEVSRSIRREKELQTTRRSRQDGFIHVAMQTQLMDVRARCRASSMAQMFSPPTRR